MTTPDQSIEQETQAKGKTAPRVTPADIEAAIASEHYFTGREGVHGANDLKNRLFGSEDADGQDDLVACFVPESLRLLTFCVLVLRNGRTATGVSEESSAWNFDAKVSQLIARAKAEEKAVTLINLPPKVQWSR